jgi:flagellar biosynthesis chaperone FliJ
MRTIAIANQTRITTAVGDDGCRPAGSQRLPLQLFVGSTESRPTEIFLRGGASWRLVNMMPGYDHEPEKNWDEYDWERFLQQQDHKTEKYMELLEKYIDHPQRDQIIAREMGWIRLLDGKANDWSEEIDALLAEDDNAALDDDRLRPSGQVELPGESFEDHVLYRAAFALTVWIDQLFDKNATLQNEPPAVKLATHAALASAKLAAALSDDDVEELGMTIAYLKRALKAITVAMDGGAQLLAEKLVNPQQYAVLQQRLFQVRDGIILLMGEYRGEWLRRYGNL